MNLPLWSQTQYSIDALLEPNSASITVSQTIYFKNTSKAPLSYLYLYDWSNSYKGAPSPLADHLANQFNRSFYLRSKSKLGYTQIQSISTNSNELLYNRLDYQIDVLKVILEKPLAPDASIEIKVAYEIKIPDDTFTGVGIQSDKSFLLRDTFITVAPLFEDDWLLNSNLGFRDNSILPSQFSIKFTFPNSYVLHTNLQLLSSEKNISNLIKTETFSSNELSCPEFVFQLENTFQEIKTTDSFYILTDILPSKNSSIDLVSSVNRIDTFIKKYLSPIPNNKIMVLKKDYNRNPIVGISEALSFLEPFPEEFIYETKFLKAYLASYLNELLVIDKRKNHWIPGGIQTYILMKYVDTYYPDSKFLGELQSFSVLGIRPFKNYSAANIGYNESFSFIYEFSEHANRQQSDTLGKEKLTKSNELYASPYHVGSGLHYLDAFLDEDVIKKGLLDFSKQRGKKELQKSLSNYTEKNLDWFFKTYLSDREAHDFFIKKVTKKPTEIEITLSEKNDKSAPVKLDLIQKDKLIYEQWIEFTGKDTIITFPGDKEIDFVAINSNQFLPDKNHLNNWKFLQSSTGLKPLQFTFYGDSENLKRNQIFYHPISDFNIYDGFTAGMRIYNTRVKNQPFELDLHPQYSIKESEWVGFFRTRYRFINHKSKNYLNQVFLTGKTYHYNTNLRYTSIQPSFSMYFRPYDLQSNKRQLLNVSWYNVFRDRNPEIEVSPDYSIISLLHRYENSNAVNTFSTNSNTEIANNFAKIYFSSEYRKLFRSGRQLSLRFFAGKFLWHNRTETQFFDFNLNRSPDYLFRYDYLGRSEDSGIYSQQFIPVEGGFKAFFEESSANDYMVSLNGSIGLWKWIEFYGDLGVLKNQNRNAVGYFDSGVKFNLVPDYFEIFFPLYSSNGFEPTQSRYATKIRFIFTPRLNTISSLFTRKWF